MEHLSLNIFTYFAVEGQCELFKEVVSLCFLSSHSEICSFGSISKIQKFFMFVEENAYWSLWSLQSKFFTPILDALCFSGR